MWQHWVHSLPLLFSAGLISLRIYLSHRNFINGLTLHCVTLRIVNFFGFLSPSSILQHMYSWRNLRISFFCHPHLAIGLHVMCPWSKCLCHFYRYSFVQSADCSARPGSSGYPAALVLPLLFMLQLGTPTAALPSTLTSFFWTTSQGSA